MNDILIGLWNILSLALMNVDFDTCESAIHLLGKVKPEERAEFFEYAPYENWYGTIMHSALSVNHSHFCDCDDYPCNYIHLFTLDQETSSSLNSLMVKLLRLGGRLDLSDYYGTFPLTKGKSVLHVQNLVVSNGFKQFAALFRGYTVRRLLEREEHVKNFSDSLDLIYELGFVPEGLCEVIPYGGLKYREGKESFNSLKR
jgi:hypothetical protein